jgi:hypothetical protein
LRLWHLPYSYLDQQRLLSQHLEVHGLATCIARGRNWGTITAQFKGRAGYLNRVHNKCVLELAIRKGSDPEDYIRDHTTPFDMERFELDQRRLYEPNMEDLRTDVEQLRAKWEREGYFFGTGRKDLRHAERQASLPEGRPKEECLELKAQTRKLVLDHKPVLKEMGDLRLGEKLDRLKEMLGDPVRPTN